MARISQQTKDVLTGVSTIGVGLATGFLVDEVSKNEGHLVSLLVLIACGLGQLALALVESEDMAELKEYREAEKVSLRIKSAIAAQVIKQAEAGNLPELLWQNTLSNLQQPKEPK